MVTSGTVTVEVLAVPGLTLTLGVDKDRGYVGETFTFYGTYTMDGAPVPYVTVTLYKDGAPVGSATTAPDGSYTIPWRADAPGTFTFYAEAPAVSPPTVGTPVEPIPGTTEPAVLGLGRGAVVRSPALRVRVGRAPAPLTALVPAVGAVASGLALALLAWRR